MRSASPLNTTSTCGQTGRLRKAVYSVGIAKQTIAGWEMRALIRSMTNGLIRTIAIWRVTPRVVQFCCLGGRSRLVREMPSFCIRK